MIITDDQISIWSLNVNKNIEIIIMKALSRQNGSELPPSSDVVRRIIRYIKSENLKPGDRLPAIRELAQLWRMKAGLIRDALLRAQTLGIIRLEPRSGVFVKQFDYQQLADLLADITELAIRHTNPRQLYLYDARFVIETETFRRAATRHTPEDVHELQEKLMQLETAKDRMTFVLADEQFHLAIARISGNPILTTVLEAISAMMRADRILMKRPRQYMIMINREHRQMYKAIINGNQDQAAELAAQHLGRMRQIFLEQFNRVLIN